MWIIFQADKSYEMIGLIIPLQIVFVEGILFSLCPSICLLSFGFWAEGGGEDI